MLKQPILKPYQAPAAQSLLGMALAQADLPTVDASEPGIGKTWIAAWLAWALLKQDEIDHVAVVCPAAVRNQWRDVLARHGITPLFVESYEKLSQGRTAWFSKGAQTNDGRPMLYLDHRKLLLVDEAHKCRGVNSAMSKIAVAARHAQARGLRVHLMSGTLGTTPLDFYAIGFLFRWHNLISFSRWCRARGCAKGEWGMEYNSASNGMQQVHEALAPRMVRLRKRDVPGFPEKSLEICVLSEGPKRTISLAIQRTIDESVTVQKGSREPANKLLGLAAKVRHAVEDAKVPLTRDVLLDDLEAGFSIVWFFNFDSSIEAAGRLLTELQIPFALIKGGMTDADRTAMQTQFVSNAVRVILVNLAAGGTGLNLGDLDGAHPRMVLMNLSHQVICVAQGFDRTHRADSKSPTTIKVLLADVGLEKRMKKAVQAKLDNIDTLNDGDVNDGVIEFLTKQIAATRESHETVAFGTDIPLPFSF